jgi:hypothetical protein
MDEALISLTQFLDRILVESLGDKPDRKDHILNAGEF